MLTFSKETQTCKALLCAWRVPLPTTAGCVADSSEGQIGNGSQGRRDGREREGGREGDSSEGEGPELDGERRPSTCFSFS